MVDPLPCGHAGEFQDSQSAINPTERAHQRCPGDDTATGTLSQSCTEIINTARVGHRGKTQSQLQGQCH